MKRAIWISTVLFVAAAAFALGQGRGGQRMSPASQRPPQSVTPQTYPPELVKAGEARFAKECAFCHGRDAAGSDDGPDLTRATIVAQDTRGDQLGPFLRTGRVEKGMPAFDLNDADLPAIVAFIHAQKAILDTLNGDRRQVDPVDLRTGNVEAGRQYFNGAGNCAKCHSATGDLAGVANRAQGRPLLQRMLYPGGGGRGGRAAKVTITLPSGEVINGSLASRDEFTITMTDASGMRRSFSASDVKAAIDDPLAAHFEQLGKYTDTDMHNVFAYLETLR